MRNTDDMFLFQFFNFFLCFCFCFRNPRNLFVILSSVVISPSLLFLSQTKLVNFRRNYEMVDQNVAHSNEKCISGFIPTLVYLRSHPSSINLLLPYLFKN